MIWSMVCLCIQAHSESLSVSISFWNCEVRVLRIEILAIAICELHVCRMVVRCWAVTICPVT